jgi:anti-sigma B factor antagonist
MAQTAHYQTSVPSEVVGSGTEIIELNGEFDMSNCGEVERRLSEAALRFERTDIVVDLRGVSFLDSTALHLLSREVTRANERGTGFALIRPNSLVWRAFALTGLSQRFITYSSLHEAMSER